QKKEEKRAAKRERAAAVAIVGSASIKEKELRQGPAQESGSQKKKDAIVTPQQISEYVNKMTHLTEGQREKVEKLLQRHRLTFTHDLMVAGAAKLEPMAIKTTTET